MSAKGEEPFNIDDYYQACDRCSKDLDQAIADLRLAKTSQPTLEWYQNPWAIVGLTLITGAVGYELGKRDNGF